MNNVRRFRNSILGAGCALALAALVPFAFADGKSEKPKAYPLKTCAVSGEKLGAMGSPYVFTHEGQEIKLCCKGCLKNFKKDPAKYIKKLTAGDAKDGKKHSGSAHSGCSGHQH